MNRIIAVFAISVACVSGAMAQGPKNLKAIEQQLAQTKSTSTAITLIESIADTTPQTDEDVAALGRLMDNYPVQGQKALEKITDPKLAGAIQTECANKIDKFKADKDKDWSKLPAEERNRDLGAFISSESMIATLGRLRNKDSVAFLKQYITPEYDGTLSYAASKAIGAIAPNDPAVFQQLWNQSGVQHISYSAYGPSVLKEVAQKRQDPNISPKEKDRILARANLALLGGRSKEEKALMKDILLNSLDSDLREEVAIGMTHAVMNNRENTDKDFVMEWSGREKSLAQNEVISVMGMVWDNRFTPEIIRMMQTSAYSSVRVAAADSLGSHKVKV